MLRVWRRRRRSERRSCEAYFCLFNVDGWMSPLGLVHKADALPVPSPLSSRLPFFVVWDPFLLCPLIHSSLGSPCPYPSLSIEKLSSGRLLRFVLSSAISAIMDNIRFFASPISFLWWTCGRAHVSAPAPFSCRVVFSGSVFRVLGKPHAGTLHFTSGAAGRVPAPPKQLGGAPPPVSRRSSTHRRRILPEPAAVHFGGPHPVIHTYSFIVILSSPLPAAFLFSPLLGPSTHPRR